MSLSHGDKQIALPLERLKPAALPREDNRHGKFPKTDGMSGSPLLLLMEKGEEVSSQKHMAIVGVFIEYDGPGFMAVKIHTSRRQGYLSVATWPNLCASWANA